MKKTILLTTIGVLAVICAALLYSVLSKEFKTEQPEFTQNTESIENTFDNENAPKPEPNYADFTVYSYENDEYKLSDIVSEGKPTVINFWATWCGYCKEEMPDFDSVYREYKDRVNFMMIDVCGHGNDDRDKAQSYVENEGFEFPVYYDDKLSAAQTYGIGSFPTTVIIDGDGVISYASPGMMDRNKLVALIDSAIR